ncbi:MAG TPA: DUF3109 family protein [Lacibacter sp.]|nr:DUF3109 family protein [Lacibacter sp.]HMO88112.1 DUF3109 family protein [Lacibacter sp.]HMP87205.1 DUF3109 family protein [Lacibacter sp.]
MIVIDDIYISDEVVQEQFVCDLQRCKGGCCVEGDAGAPLTDAEKQEVEQAYAVVAHRLTPEGREVVARGGYFVYNQEFGWVTPTISNGMCAYGTVDAQGLVKCSFEEAHREGLLQWKKPLSCHLFPVKITRSRHADHEYVNYEPRPGLCNPGCTLGQQLKMPVYVFLKEALVRKYGEDFYEVLTQIASQYYETTPSP